MAHSQSSAGARWALAAPRYWPSWLVLGLGRLIVLLPTRGRTFIGNALGALARCLAGRRKSIATTNLALCFPEQPATERQTLMRRHFALFGNGIVETAMEFWASDATLDALVRFEGLDHLEEAARSGRGLILISAHFTPLVLGVRVAQRPLATLGVSLNAMYKAFSDPVMDRALQRAGASHLHGEIIPHHNAKHAIKRVKNGQALWYAGDQKAGQRAGVAADFFGQPVQTHVSIFRIARLTGAALVPYFIHRRHDGTYDARFLPAIDYVASGDEAAGAARVNALIEAEVRKAPAEYFWLHRRFRRPDFDPYNGA